MLGTIWFRHAVIVFVLAVYAVIGVALDGAEQLFPGADQHTPARSEYFSWINNTNEGSTEAQTIANLEFFAWMKEQYGMQLDIYAWDAGNLDGSRASGGYGSFNSERFHAHYPHGWQPIAARAASFGCRMGLWGGPDGYGDTPEQAVARRETMVSLCRDLHFELFKLDGVCGPLRLEKQGDFVTTMIACRKYSPDLIILNHRLDLGKGLPYVTTNLWEGAETYIDILMINHGTATHHRAGALSRGIPDGMSRLLEDHGVCLSSCLDGWDDDLVLQAFNRALVLSPEIYGNPWFLRDDEFPKLARLFNLQRRYRDLLVDGMRLNESDYGPLAVSRGDKGSRMITLRNLSWNPVTYHLHLDEAIGLTGTKDIELWKFHPGERFLGKFPHGAVADVEVQPFRSCLLLASDRPVDEVGVEGCEAEVISDVANRPVHLHLLGAPGSTAKVIVHPGRFHVVGARIEGVVANDLARGQAIPVTFPGTAMTKPFHRKLADLTALTNVPADAEALYEATCFAADSNALEFRSLERAGETRFPAVQHARDAFLGQALLRSRGCSDRWLFDGDANTGFYMVADVSRAMPSSDPKMPKMLRLDLGHVQNIDALEISISGGSTSGDIEVSADLRSWSAVRMVITPGSVRILLPPGRPIRYLRMDRGSLLPNEITATLAGKTVPRIGWRASNLFTSYASHPAQAAWSAEVMLDQVAPNSYLCIALDGEHGVDGAWAAARLQGQPIGCPDRASSFDSNLWEYDGGLHHVDRDYTYYLPITPAMMNKKLELVALTLAGGKNGYKPSVWITSMQPYVSRDVLLQVK